MADNNIQPNEQYQYYQAPNPQPVEEKASVGLAILSFLIPLAGLIIFIVNKDKKPKTAKASGICALVSVILTIIISVIMTVAGGALIGSAVDDALDGETSYGDTISADSNDDNGTVLTGNTIGDYGCVVKSAELTKDYEGKDAVIITYEFTNNSDSAISFDMALVDSVFQNGIGLESVYFLENDEDMSIWDVEIKPGVTKDTKRAYLLNDKETPLEVEISELFSWDDSKIVTTIELG